MIPNGVTKKTRVLVVDDHRSYAQAMALVISMQPDLSGRAVLSGSEAERTVLEDPPDIVLIDAGSPGPESLTTAARLLERVPHIRVLVLSNHDDDVLRTRARRAGVYGFLSKFEPIDHVLEAIRRAASGQPVGDRAVEVPTVPVTRKRRRLPHATERQRSERLSPREREILQLMVDGNEPRQIVAQLGISPATLRTHVQNILTKLGVHSKTQAVLMAVRQGKVSTRR